MERGRQINFSRGPILIFLILPRTHRFYHHALKFDATSIIDDLFLLREGLVLQGQLVILALFVAHLQICGKHIVQSLAELRHVILEGHVKCCHAVFRRISKKVGEGLLCSHLGNLRHLPILIIVASPVEGLKYSRDGIRVSDPRRVVEAGPPFLVHDPKVWVALED